MFGTSRDRPLLTQPKMRRYEPLDTPGESNATAMTGSVVQSVLRWQIQETGDGSPELHGIRTAAYSLAPKDGCEKRLGRAATADTARVIHVEFCLGESVASTHHVQHMHMKYMVDASAALRHKTIGEDSLHGCRNSWGQQSPRIRHYPAEDTGPNCEDRARQESFTVDIEWNGLRVW